MHAKREIPVFHPRTILPTLMAKKAAKKEINKPVKKVDRKKQKKIPTGKAAGPSVAAVKDLQAAAASPKTVSCVFGCLTGIAPGANITENSILSRIPVPDLVALGQCINGCVPLNDPNCWGGGVVIDGGWRVSDLIDETETLRNNA
jgi:hypothetical protein